MRLLITKTVALVIAALSLAPSFAHALESYPRLMIWSPELWRDATVFNAQFWLFAVIGAPIDVLAILVPAGLTGLLRGKRPQFALALAATLTFALGLALWFAIVATATNACDLDARPDRGGFRRTSAGSGTRSPDDCGRQADRVHAVRTGVRVARSARCDRPDGRSPYHSLSPRHAARRQEVDLVGC